VIVGVRPEDFEDAAFAPSSNGCSLDVRVSLAEPMGAEVIAHFPLAAEPFGASSSVAAALGAEAEDDASQLLRRAAGQGSGNVMLTARLNPRSRARTNQPLRVAVDVEHLHFFDPKTEAAV
jgi:multiple sugar transport system ATP-binding protein